MGTTLVVGRDEDLCCKLVRDRLTELGREVLYLRENDLFPGMDFVWELNQGKSRGSVGRGGHRVPFEELDGVLARFTGITTSAEEHKTKDGQYLNSEWHALARGYIHSLPCPVVNRLRPELWYKQRLSTADFSAMAPQARFLQPRTLVTTNFAEVGGFFELCGRRMRYSPISLPANYVIEDAADLEKLERLCGVMPLFLSEVVNGTAVRAFVVGREVVFDGEGSDTASEACRESAARLGLTFCEFELVETARGDWYCQGVQCAPYLFDCSEEARARVIDLLIGELCAGDERRPS